MRCGRTFRLAKTHPAHARWSGSETLSRSRSLVGYTIDTHGSEFSEATPPTHQKSVCDVDVAARGARAANGEAADHRVLRRPLGIGGNPLLPNRIRALPCRLAMIHASPGGAQFRTKSALSQKCLVSGGPNHYVAVAQFRTPVAVLVGVRTRGRTGG